MFPLIYLLVLSFSFCAHHTKEEWKSRSIYQLLTDRFASTDDNIKDCTNLGNYCGGTFKGIMQHLDYIAGMGFDAIWISPPLKNKEGSYHGYHNIDIYNINEHFGTKDELKQLIDECHKRDIWVILDAVPNHMAGDLDISTFIPFNKDSHYHTLTETDCNGHWNEQYYKENCRIWNMPDLAQEKEEVETVLLDWLKSMLSDYGFDGIRYADVPNVPQSFWGKFTEAAQTYTLGIVGVDTGSNQDLRVLDNFIQNLQTIYTAPQYNGNWIGNHDKQRFLYECQSSYKRKALRNGIIFTLFFEGIPMFYYGDEQYFNGGNDPNNREILFGKYNTQSDIYQMVKIANSVRKMFKIYDYDFMRRYSDEHYYAFSRGKVLIIISDGTPDKTKITLTKHGFEENDKLCNEINRNECVDVKNNKIEVTMEGEPKIFIKYTNINSTKFIVLSLWLYALVLFYI